MTTQKSLHNQSSFLGNYLFILRRNIGLMIMNFVIGFVTSGLFFIIRVFQDDSMYRFQSVSPMPMLILSLIATSVFAVLIPLMVNSYLFNKRAIDVYHSIPISRKNLFLSNYLAGYTVLMIPVLLNLLICLSSMPYLVNQTEMSYDSFFEIVKVFICGLTFVYSVVIFIMVNCGTTFETLAYTAMFNIAPILFVISIMSACAKIYLGMGDYAQTTYDILPFISPVLAMGIFGINGNYDSTAHGFFYLDRLSLICVCSLVWSAIFIIGGTVLYKKRKSESAGSPFAFKTLYNILSVLGGAAVGVGISSSKVFGYNQAVINIMIGFVFGVIAYLVLEAIAHRGFKGILKSLIKAGIVSAILGIFFGASYLTEGFGYSKRVPEISKIESVDLKYNGFELPQYGYGSPSKDLIINFKQEQNIKIILDIHKNAITNAKYGDSNNYYNPEEDNVQYVNLEIDYKLKNGLTQKRYYNYISNENVQKVNDLRNTEEYGAQRYSFMKNMKNPISIQMSVESVNNLKVTYDPAQWSFTTEEKKKLFEAITEDVNSISSEQINRPKSACVAVLKLYSSKDSMTQERVYIYQNYTKSCNILKNKGILQIDTDIESTELGYINKDQYGKYKEDQWIDELHKKVLVSDSPIDISNFMTSPTTYGKIAKKQLSEEKITELMRYVQPYYFSDKPCSIVVTDWTTFIVPP
ncbi:MAG: putative rane protein, partial [Oscillospiraceae bacterium]|nr:putative rane protein [Oscillospiraceae bacterium]